MSGLGAAPPPPPHAPAPVIAGASLLVSSALKRAAASVQLAATAGSEAVRPGARAPTPASNPAPGFRAATLLFYAQRRRPLHPACCPLHGAVIARGCCAGLACGLRVRGWGKVSGGVV